MNFKIKMALRWTGWSLPVLAAGYLFLLCFPQPLFAYKFPAGNLTLYCDDPIPQSAGEVLREAQGRLDKSPLRGLLGRQNVFICNQSWRYKWLANRNANGGGLAYGFCPWNVFLRKSDIARNILFRGDGVTPSGPDRPLSYFIAHEMTHNLTSRFLGPLAGWRLSAWKKEGYADYVGKGGQFDFQKNLDLFKKNDEALNPSQSGLYLRYQLMVAYLLDWKKITVEEMLRGNFNRENLEAEIRALPDKVR